MNYFPIFSQLKSRPVLVVGGGHVALRKIELLRQAQAKVLLVADKLHPEVEQLVQDDEIKWLATEFAESQLINVFLVVATTNDQVLNQQVAELAERHYKLCNVVDNQPLCSFIMPSIIDRGDLQVAISTGGKAPVLARLWREKLEALLPHYLVDMTEITGRWREKVKTQLSKLTQRRRFWEKMFNNQHFAKLCEGQRLSEAEAMLADELQQPQPIKGEVTLVGAGPGNPELLTLKGLRHIQQADIVLYDALVSEEILDLIRRDADRVYVGKRAAQHYKKQDEINGLILKYAQQGKRVVRLKGGDPFVFGRGGEELEGLVEAEIPFSVVPGITAGVGVTAYAGIPLTHRNLAQSATFVTGHSKQNGKSLDWKTLAMTNHTLVIYMGSLKSAEISEQLISHGREANTPVAVIGKGTRADQEVIVGTLNNLATLAKQAPKPALIVIGEVVKLQSQLRWFST